MNNLKICKECGEAEWRDTQAATPDKTALKKEQLRRNANRWYLKHKNTEKYKKMHREYARKWVEKNKDKYNEYQREYKRKYRAKKKGVDKK